MTGKTRGAFEMTAAMTISGTVGWFVVSSGQPTSSVVFWRCLFGALAMMAVCAFSGFLRPGILNRNQIALSLLGGLALVMNWGLLFGSYSYASISISTVIYHTQPFMLTALGAIFFKEELTLEKMGWLFISFAGLIAIILARSELEETGSKFLFGVAMALGAALFYAIAAIITKRLKGVPPHLIVLIQLIVGSVVLGPFAGQPSGLQTWSILVTIGVIHTGLMSTLLYGAIQKIPTSLIGALSFIYPVVAILVDWIAFGHRMSAIQIAGATAILISAIGMNFGWPLWRKAHGRG